MEFSWAEEYPDVHKICVQFSMTELSSPINYKYKPLPSIIQEGPTCGLVALAMCLENPTDELVENILQEAKCKNFTNNGEMFSADNMAELARNFMKNEVILHDNNLLDSNVMDSLLSGKILLVPYDSDRDHSPCNKKGHKAHWAVLSGVIQTDDDVYVIAKQGKSRRPMIWRLSSLAESNSQLTEVCPERENSNQEYVIPVDGIGGSKGLKNKYIVISPN